MIIKDKYGLPLNDGDIIMLESNAYSHPRHTKGKLCWNEKLNTWGWKPFYMPDWQILPDIPIEKVK